MLVPCLARDSRGSCFVAKPELPVPIAITGSVGVAGGNQPNDVRTIQAALNDVEIVSGGADPLLAVDGISGPLTARAIATFQQRQLGFSDSRVDPNGKTIRALNATLGLTLESGGAALSAQSAAGAGAPARRGRNAPSGLLPNPFIVAVIASLVPEVRKAIRAAHFHLDAADRHVTNRKQEMPQGPFLAPARESLSLLNAVFDFFKFPNPRPAFENLRTVYRNMDVALNRSFETAPLVAAQLFVGNPKDSMETKAAAYTSAGGAFIGPKVLLAGLGLPANRIYLCSNLALTSRAFQIMAILHELAHYVSGQAILIDDHVKGHFFTDADTPKMNALSPQLKIRNAEHYAAFAFIAGGPQIFRR